MRRGPRQRLIRCGVQVGHGKSADRADPLKGRQPPWFRNTRPTRGRRERPRESSLNRHGLYRNDAKCSEHPGGTRLSLHLAAARYTPTGFRFRRRKAWWFKSLLVHWKLRNGAEVFGEALAWRGMAWRVAPRRQRDLADDRRRFSRR